MNDVDRLFHVVFRTPEGQDVLDLLRKKTIEQPTMGGSGDGAALALAMAKREGENSLYRFIKNAYERGKKNDS